MKSCILSIALLCSPIVTLQAFQEDAVQEIHSAQESASVASEQEEAACAVEEQEEEDLFDAFMDEGAPEDMIVQPKPVSAVEAYARQVGVQLLMKYIGLKIWLEHHWNFLTAPRA